MKPIDQYDKHGYLVLRNFFSEIEISLIDQHVDRIYRKWIRKNEAEIFNNRLVNMHSLTCPEYFEGLHEERTQFFRAIASIKLTEVMDNIFGSGIYFHNTQLFFNPSNKKRFPYWHRDLQYSLVEDAIQSNEQHSILNLHVRIPLVEEKGIEVVRGSHKRWDTELEHNVRLELNGHKNHEPLPDAVLINLVPGDILIFNGQMIHRGNYDLNPARKAFDLCVGKYHPLTSVLLDERVLPNEDEMESIANNQWYKLAQEIVANRSGKKSTPNHISS